MSDSVAQSFLRKDNEDQATTTIGHGGDFGRYTIHKERKLRSQFHQKELCRFNVTNSGSTIFSGVCIFVNGYTKPSHQELKTLMAQHGGTFENYFHSPPVTHFICANLPSAKVKQLKKERHSVPVVHPYWIVESIKSQELLPIGNYQHNELKDSNDQPIRKFLIGDESSKKRLKSTHESNDEFCPSGSDAAQSDFHMGEGGTWKMRIENFIHETRKPTRSGNVMKKSVEFNRVVVHVDLDCFFASVAMIDQPELKNVPFVVCHSQKRDGTAEISCASYPARELGIRAGSFISSAFKLCPTLHVVPYQFDKYQKISEQVYGILLKYCDCVEPVSCDEAYLDVTNMVNNEVEDVEEMVLKLRREIEAETQCTASAGIGPNKLIAKIATTKAKPNGQFKIDPSQIPDTLNDMEIANLPGIGWSRNDQMQKLGVMTVGDVEKLSLQELEGEFGEKTGQMIWNYAHGIDDRLVKLPEIRKSISAECNWGIRLTTKQEVEDCISEILNEVLKRMNYCQFKGRCISLKIRKRQDNAPLPRKYLGCGLCDDFVRSHTLDQFSINKEIFIRHLWEMYLQLQIPINEIRGIGITISKLNKQLQGKHLLYNNLDAYTVEGKSIQAPQSALSIKRKGASKTKSRQNKKMKSSSNLITCPVRLIQHDDLVLEDVDPDVLSALPDSLQKEILQNLPIKRNRPMLSGANEAQDEILRSPRERMTSFQNNDDKSLEELLASNNCDKIPLKLEQLLDELLGNGTEIDYSMVEQVFNVLNEWIEDFYQEEMETIISILKVVRRFGVWYPVLFEECGRQFIQSVQNSVHKKTGFWLKLRVHL
eukprot:g7126.t1